MTKLFLLVSHQLIVISVLTCNCLHFCCSDFPPLFLFIDHTGPGISYIKHWKIKGASPQLQPSKYIHLLNYSPVMDINLHFLLSQVILTTCIWHRNISLCLLICWLLHHFLSILWSHRKKFTNRTFLLQIILLSSNGLIQIRPPLILIQFVPIPPYLSQCLDN